MPSEGNIKYASYFVDSEKRMLRDAFEIDLSSNSSDTVKANAEFIISSDKETGDFKVHPVIMRNKAVYVAMIDGEYNFTGNLNGYSGGKVTYVKVPALGTKNISNIYAATLNEAVGIRNQSTEKLAKIEAELSKEDQAAIEKNATIETQEEKVDTDELLNGEAEANLLEEGSTAEESIGEDAAVEIPFTEEDVDALGQKLAECNKVSEDFLIEYLLTTLDEQVEGELDREEWIPKTKENLTRGTEELMKNMPVKSSIISEATRRQLLIDNLVFQLKENIKAGKTKVYTNLTKEEIC